MAKKKQPVRHKSGWSRRLGALALWGPVAIVGVLVVLAVYAVARSAGGAGGGVKSDSSVQVAETPSDPSKGQPFQGGPKLYFPVESMDLGHVPLMTNVSKSFDLENVGDSPLTIQDVQVAALEGC